jgi:UDP-N-acetylmuramate dehydrogenase
MQKQINLAHHSTLKIGPIVDVEMIESSDWNKVGYTIIGAGSNILFSPTPPPLAKLSKVFEYIKIEDNILKVGAATSSGKLLSFVKKNDIANFEFLPKLPGVVGGMVKMNAGLKEFEIFNHLIGVETNLGYLAKEDIDFGYRHSDIKGVILAAHFQIEKGFSTQQLEKFNAMRDNQPNDPSAGSCFANPYPLFAAKLLEEVGLKGYQIGQMGFSKKHANFLINLGGGTYEDARSLIEEAKKRVKEATGTLLHEEIISL